MLRLAVIGKDVSRSLSPVMHRFLLGKMGVPCSYEAVSIPPVQFAARAQELFERFDAFNVTIPFKGKANSGESAGSSMPMATLSALPQS